MFFFDEDETPDEIIFRFRNRGILLLALITSVMISLLFPYLLELLTPWVMILINLLPVVVLFVFFIDVIRVTSMVRKEKKKGRVQASRKMFSLDNLWTITLKKN
ncbi:MAG: hypothetical protein V1726_08735 [Methanobacteriota archaeon]